MRRAAAALALVLAAAHAQAGPFLSVGEPAVVLYDAPSRNAKPMYVASRHYPVEVIVNLEAWVKVRDHTGTLTWVERKSLVDERTVVVIAPAAEARVRPEDGAPVSFVAAQNVALQLLGMAPGGWLRVRHADGADGYVRTDQVWGA
ncbi:MAG: SH3 domain-containing protein [Burkholderiales bacterium]